jgi:tetratricopeptide (TPR) repeat protein
MNPILLQALSLATVRICKSDGQRLGQGVCVAIPGREAIVLTCYHVVAGVDKADAIPIDLFSAHDLPLRRVLARYVAERSEPEHDIAVLMLAENIEVPLIRLARLSPALSGRRPVMGIVRPNAGSQRFNADLAEATPLLLNTTGFRGTIPSAFRLIHATDVRPGVSGSPVVLGDAVIGLTHFSRAENDDYAREGYVVPVAEWLTRNPELALLTTLHVDAALENSAIVKTARDLNAEADFGLLDYQERAVFETAGVRQAASLLSEKRRCLVIGRPHSGKTFIAYRTAREWRGIIVLPLREEPPDGFDRSSLPDESVLLLIDDLQERHAFNFTAWQRALSGSDPRRGFLPPALLVTSRDGPDWRRVKQNAPQVHKLFDIEAGDACVYACRVGKRGHDIDWVDGQAFARNIGMSDLEYARRFDGTIGSIMLDLAAMRARYDQLRERSIGNVQASRLLDALKFLYVIHSPLIDASVRSVAEQIRGAGPLSPEIWDELKRLTAEAGFGFFDARSVFRTYRPYFSNCVRYEPSAEDLHRYASLRAQEGDAWGLLTTGIKLTQMDDDRGIEALSHAAMLGSISALRGMILLSADHRERLPTVIRVTHELIRRGHENFLDTLGTLYRRWGKKRLAEAAYRKAIRAGERFAGQSLATLLLEDPQRQVEGQNLLRQALANNRNALCSIQLAGSLFDDLGAESEVERLLRQAVDGGLRQALLLLGCFLVVWPGHMREGVKVLEPVVERSDEWDNASAWIACESLKLAASLSEDEDSYQRWQRKQSELGIDRSGRDSELQTSWTARIQPDDPTTFKDGPIQGSADGVIASSSHSHFAMPGPIRHEILNDGWDRAWSPTDQDLAHTMREYDAFSGRGYGQARLITGVLLYRVGANLEAAESALRSALESWPEDDIHSVRGKLTLAAVLLENGRQGEFAALLRDAATGYGTSVSGDTASQWFRMVTAVSEWAETSEHFADSIGVWHRQLSMLWLALGETGPAWFEDLKWKAAVQPEVLHRLAVSPPDRMPQLHVRALGGTKILAHLRNRKTVRMLIREVAPAMPIEIESAEGGLRLSSDWLGITPSDTPARHQMASILLPPAFFLDAEPAKTTSIVRFEPRFDTDAGDEAQLTIYVGLFVDCLKRAGDLLSEPFGMKVDFEIARGDGLIGITPTFAIATPAEAIDTAQVLLQTTAEAPAFDKAALHVYVAERFLALHEGSRKDNIASAVSHFREAEKLCRKNQNRWFWGNLQAQLGRAHLAQGDFTAAATCFKAALSVLTEKVDPFEWATLQALLAVCHTGTGAHHRNAAAAVACCEAALRVFDQKDHPFEWASATEHLGLAYLLQHQDPRQTSDARQQAIAVAIGCFESALQVNTRSTTRYRWAALQSHLGTSHALVDGPDYRETIGKAIVCFNAALEVFSETEYPGDWAIVQAKLSDVYARQAAWLAPSMAEAIRCAQAALRTVRREHAPVLWANLHLLLGRAIARQKSGGGRQILETVIAHYCAAVDVFGSLQDVDRPFRANLLQELGRAYQQHAQHTPESLQNAIQCFERSLSIGKKASPIQTAGLHDYMGMCYFRLESGSRKRNLAKARSHCMEALKVYTKADYPVDWAMVRENLGRIELNRWQYDPAMIAEAVAHHNAAIDVYTRAATPYNWGANQDYLGLCHLFLQHPDRRQNIDKAMAYCTASLEIFDAGTYPGDRAFALENVGKVHLAARFIHGESSVLSSIECFEAALRLIDREEAAARWASLQDSLGTAYCCLERPERVDDLDRSVAFHRAALTIYNEAGFRASSAAVQMNLGVAHAARAAKGVRGAAEQASAAFTSASSVVRREDAPRTWALIQNGLASAQRDETAGDARRLERAVSLHLEALKVLTHSGFPQDHADAHFELAVTRTHISSRTNIDQSEEIVRSLAIALEFYTQSSFPCRWAEIRSMETGARAE